MLRSRRRAYYKALAAQALVGFVSGDVGMAHAQDSQSSQNSQNAQGPFRLRRSDAVVVTQGGGSLPVTNTGDSFCSGWCVAFVVLFSIMIAAALCVWAKAMRDRALREEGLAEARV